MKHGFIKIGAATPKIKVADCANNAEEIKKQLDEAREQKAKVVVFPELCITGYTCEDLFMQETLLAGAREALTSILDFSKDMDMVFFVGLPMEHYGKLYNVMAACCQGKVLGLVPKRNIPSYSVYYERRHFTAGPLVPEWMNFLGERFPSEPICYLPVRKCRI